MLRIDSEDVDGVGEISDHSGRFALAVLCF